MITKVGMGEKLLAAAPRADLQERVVAEDKVTPRPKTPKPQNPKTPYISCKVCCLRMHKKIY